PLPAASRFDEPRHDARGAVSYAARHPRAEARVRVPRAHNRRDAGLGSRAADARSRGPPARTRPPPDAGAVASPRWRSARGRTRQSGARPRGAGGSRCARAARGRGGGTPPPRGRPAPVLELATDRATALDVRTASRNWSMSVCAVVLADGGPRDLVRTCDSVSRQDGIEE